MKKKRKKDLEKKQEKEKDVEEYVLFFALFGSMTPREDTWLIYSGASNNMTWQKKNMSKHEENNSPWKVTLGDYYQYPIKGIGESSYKIDYGTTMNMKEVLYVLGLNKNLIYISILDKKGYRVAFIYGQVIIWPKGK